MPQFNASDLAEWSKGAWVPSEPSRVAGVSIDTRALNRDALFVALAGEHADGHTYVSAALEQGAAGALVGIPFQQQHPDVGPLLAVEDPLKALQDIARGHRTSRSARFVGVTGSVGKTTVKELLAGMLARVAPTARTQGNWNNHIGLPLSLLRMDSADKFGVFEVGINHVGEMDDLCELLKPDVGVITRIGPAHLEFFDSVEQIAEEKAKLFSVLPKDGLAVCSLENPWYTSVVKKAPCRVVTTSVDREADFYTTAIDTASGTIEIGERDSSDRVSIHVPVAGAFFIEDVLLAAAAARNLGVPWENIAEAVGDYKSLAMRWKQMWLGDVLFIDDSYNANPMSMRAAIDAALEIEPVQRRILVLGGMRELGSTEEQEHKDLGQYLASRHSIKALVTVGGLGRWIAEGAGSVASDDLRIETAETPRGAAEILEELVASGDLVLLKGSRSERLDRVLEMMSQNRNSVLDG